MNKFLKLLLIASCSVLFSCTKNDKSKKQFVKVDGSSTVYPITEAIAEEYSKVAKATRVTVGVSGTGGGFKKFINNEIDINDASREIKKSEIEKAAKNGVSYIELPVAYDGISLVVHPDSFLTEISVQQLKKLWESDTVKMWNELDPSWPAEKIKLYGPGHDSGTFDYFKEVIVGKKGSFRSEYTQSEDDNMLVRGVAGDKNAIGFFGYSYYEANKDKLRALAVSNGPNTPAVVPGPTTIQDGSYAPLSRKIFIYVSQNAAKKEQVNDFVNFYFTKAMDKTQKIISQVGYIPLNDSTYQDVLKKYDNFVKSAQ